MHPQQPSGHLRELNHATQKAGYCHDILSIDTRPCMVNSCTLFPHTLYLHGLVTVAVFDMGSYIKGERGRTLLHRYSLL